MPENVTLYQLSPSPNNIKVRIALGYKKIPYEKVEIAMKGYPPAPEDRAELVKLSGQPLAPMLVHGDRKIYDSAAILRYLDAQFPEPRLFSTDFAEMKEIEKWETFARMELPQPLNECFGMVLSGSVDEKRLEAARSLLAELSGQVEDRLGSTGWLVGDRMTAADVSAVPFLHYSSLPEGTVADGPITGFLDKNLPLPAGRDNVRAWIDRVRAFDS